VLNLRMLLLLFVFCPIFNRKLPHRFCSGLLTLLHVPIVVLKPVATKIEPRVGVRMEAVVRAAAAPLTFAFKVSLIITFPILCDFF
jgi:hypothetical protein